MNDGEGARIVKLVSDNRHEEALGVALDAPRDHVNRVHVRLLHRFRREPLVRDALNRAKSVIVSESDDMRALRLISSGRLKEALPFLERAVRSRPTACRRHILGRTLSRLSRHEDAIDHLGRAVAERGDPEDLLWLGRALDGLGRHAEAVPVLERLVDLRGAPVDHHWLGVTLHALGMYEKAILHLRLAFTGGNDPMDQELAEICAKNVQAPVPEPPRVIDRIASFLASMTGSGRSK